MSTREILAELPKLAAKDLEEIWAHAGRLLERQTLVSSAALLEAIDAGDASICNETAIPLDSARQTVRSWTTQ